jgi:hypothetical protein
MHAPQGVLGTLLLDVEAGGQSHEFGERLLDDIANILKCGMLSANFTREFLP